MNISGNADLNDAASLGVMGSRLGHLQVVGTLTLAASAGAYAHVGYVSTTAGAGAANVGFNIQP